MGDQKLDRDWGAWSAWGLSGLGGSVGFGGLVDLGAQWVRGLSRFGGLVALSRARPIRDRLLC